jgi:DNA-directed RNA polymerase specialized sigma24 family protein
LPLESVEGVVDYSSPDPLQMIVAKEKTEELVRSIKNNLSDYENRVWWMYVSGMSPSEIAKEIGEVDAKSVSNAVYRIRKKLRNVIGSQQ